MKTRIIFENCEQQLTDREKDLLNFVDTVNDKFEDCQVNVKSYEVIPHSTNLLMVTVMIEFQLHMKNEMGWGRMMTYARLRAANFSCTNGATIIETGFSQQELLLQKEMDSESVIMNIEPINELEYE